MSEKFLAAIGGVVIVLVVGVGGVTIIAIIMAYPTKWVVNWLISPSALMMVFGAPALSVWKAIALNFICGSLFKGSAKCECKKA